MKKVLFSLFIGVVFALSSLAANWTAPTTYPIKVSETLTKLVYPTDSLTGTDSNTIFSGVTIDPTATYAVSALDSIGTVDSLYYSLRVYNSAGTLIWSGGVDTTSASTTYRCSSLPINKTVSGNYFTLKAIGLVAAKVKKLRSVSLIKVIPITPYQTNFTR